METFMKYSGVVALVIAIIGWYLPLGGKVSEVVKETFGGQSHTNSGFVINEDGTDDDSRIESANQTHMLFVDAGNDRIGIATSTPTDTFNVGSGSATSTVNLGRLCLQTVGSDGTSVWLYIDATNNWATSTTDTCS